MNHETNDLMQAGRYEWHAVVTRRPLHVGKNIGDDCSGVMDFAGGTVGDAVEAVRRWFADRERVPVAHVTVCAWAFHRAD